MANSGRSTRRNCDLSVKSIFELVAELEGNVAGDGGELAGNGIVDNNVTLVLEIDNQEAGLPGHNFDEEMAVMDADGIAQLIAGLDGARKKRVNPRDIPNFGGQPHEDADDWLIRYERFTDYYGMNDDDRV